MNQALIFVLETFFGLFSLALLLRFYLQAVRAPVRNPLSQFIVALTNFAVVPARRVVPGLWGYDLSSLLLAWITEAVLITAVMMLKGYPIGAAGGMAIAALCALAALSLFRTFLYIVMVAVFAQAVLSWIGPQGPALPLLSALTRPLTRVFQRRIPPIGGVDLAPLFVLVICQVLLMWPVASMEKFLTRLL